MSWDIWVVAAETPPPPVAQMPDDWEGVPFGSLKEVREIITTHLPGTDWSDVAWGTYESPGYSLEFNIGEEDPCSSFMIHVRGGGEVVSIIEKLATIPDWCVMDTSQGEWWHHNQDKEKGWKSFQEYRDYITRT